MIQHTFHSGTALALLEDTQTPCETGCSLHAISAKSKDKYS